MQRLLLIAVFSLALISVEHSFAQHHGGQQAPPISFGNGQVTVNTSIHPSDFSPDKNSSVDLRVRFFDSISNSNIENVSYRIQIFFGSSLVATQMFFDKDGELEVKVQPKSGCAEKELWKCTVYHGEKDPVVPSALTSSALSKPVIIGPVFDKPGEYTVKTSIIGATNPRTQTEEDINFETKIMIPQLQEFSVESHGMSFPIIVKTFGETLHDLRLIDSNLILDIPFAWEHLEHTDLVKATIDVPKGFTPFANALEISGIANDSKLSSKAVHYDFLSKKDLNTIHVMIPKTELSKIKQNEEGITLTLFENPESKVIKKEIHFENGFKAIVTHDTVHNSSNQLQFTITFFDQNQDVVQNIRYAYSLKDPSGKEITNIGTNPNKLGILTTGIDSQILNTLSTGKYEIQLVLIGDAYQDFPKFMYETYGFELSDGNKNSKLDIPPWIKNNAGWWSEGNISDSDFVTGVQHMIQQKIIDIPDLPQSEASTDSKVPDWVRNTAKFWAGGQISDNEFVNALKHLIKAGIIQV